MIIFGTVTSYFKTNTNDENKNPDKKFQKFELREQL